MNSTYAGARRQLMPVAHGITRLKPSRVYDNPKPPRISK